MAKLSICLLLSLIISPHLSAQNYIFITNCSSPEEKSKLTEQMKFLSEQFDMKNVTFAIMISKLPKKIEATTEYSFNKVVNRSMVLFRINANLAEQKTLKVLAHEMVHAYQFYSKALIRHNRNSFTYRGVKYHNAAAIPHAKRPWEIEAIEGALQIVGEAGEVRRLRKHRSTSNSLGGNYVGPSW